MKYLLAAVNAEDWNKLPQDVWLELRRCGVSGIDVRIANPARGPSREETTLAGTVVRHGFGLRCHAWAGVRGPGGISVADSRWGHKQGEELAVCATLLGVTELASGNFERDVWRGPDGHANPKAVDYIDAYIDAFHAKNHGCFLGDLGFANPDVHYLDADLDHDGDNDDEIPEWLVIKFKRRGIMAYQSDRGSILKKLEEGRKVSAGLPLTWWGSVGRLGSDGKVVGSASATLSILTNPPKDVDEWVGYVGFGAIRQIMDGNVHHRSLITLVSQARGGGAA